MSIIVTFKLYDSGERESEFNTFTDAVLFMHGIGECMFEWVTITDKYEHSIEGFSDITNHYDNVGDLWAGEDDCIHTKTHSGLGGGIHCNTCSAWFCY